MRSSFLILLTFILSANAQCSSTITVACQTEEGKGGDTTVECTDSTYTLVSCGIRNSATDIISKGIWMSDTKCTIDYSGATTSTSSDVKPYAQCCHFADCFNDFQCELSVMREKKRSPNAASCGSDFPHLLSCGIGVINDKQELEIYFQNSGTNSNITFDMKDEYLNLFSLPTQSPTKHPTLRPSVSPTLAPSSIKPTSSPFKPTTKAPTTSTTLAPTTLAPTYSQSASAQTYAQSVNTEWFNPTANAECVPQTQSVSNYSWLSSLCCTERDNSRYTNSPSIVSTPTPTQVPTIANPTVLWRLADVRAVYTFTTPFFPINASFNTSNEFEDVNYGKISRITWGVSNIKREYEISKAGKPGIIAQTDSELDDWYFTIKDWDAQISFTSQYGNAHIPNKEDCQYCNCTQFDGYWIQRIVVYTNTSNKKPKILGMTMTASDDTNFTCHVDMGRYNLSGAEVEATLSTENAYTLDYSSCGAYLAGFKGAAHTWGIDYIGFRFLANEDVGSCDYADAVTVSTPSPIDPTLPPSPQPTAKPTDLNPTALPTTAVDQFSNKERTLGCYYVMDKKEAKCLMDGETITSPQNIILTNPSFMTGCAGYSMSDDIKSWYIANDTCIVEGYNGSDELAAIATCCTLVDAAKTASVCGDLWCTFTTAQWVYIILGITVVVAFWIGALIWCIYATKKQADRDALEERLAKFETTENKQGEKVRILTGEQVAHQINLERFEVNAADHKEMIENERLISNDIGLIE